MMHGPALRTYITHKEGCPPYTYESIAWESFKTAFNKITSAKKLQVLKPFSVFGAPTHVTDVIEFSSNIVDYMVHQTNTGDMYSHVMV
jgi:hypothetical protein